MKTFAILCLVAVLGLPATTALAAGMSFHSTAPISGGAFGTNAATPGTNSLGTALSSSGMGGEHPMKGSLLGTSPALDRENAKVEKMIDGICRGC